jgi:mono/diheme cytochrome c family protein
MKKDKYYYLLFVLFFNLFFLPVKSDPIFEMGKTIFLEQGCAACHTLADAKSYGEMGPNLNQIKPDIARVINTVTNGIGVMPPYEGVLSTQEIKAVAHYVSISATE